MVLPWPAACRLELLALASSCVARTWLILMVYGQCRMFLHIMLGPLKGSPLVRFSYPSQHPLLPAPNIYLASPLEAWHTIMHFIFPPLK